MGVVELHGESLVESIDARLGDALQPDHVLERAGHEEVLLGEAQLLARIGVIVGVEDLGDRLGGHLVVHGPEIVAGVERREIERFRGFRLPEPQQIRRGDTVAGDGRVVGHALDDARGYPPDPLPSLLVPVMLGVPAELDVEGDLRARNLPGVAQAQPLVRHLHLPAVPDLLVEDAELVADAVPDGRHLQGGKRIHETGRQSPQAAVAEPGLFFLREELVEIELEPPYGFPGGVVDAEVDEAVTELRPHQELRGEIADHLQVLARQHALDRLDPAVQQPVAHGTGQGQVPVVARGDLRHPGLDVMQIVGHSLRERGRAEPCADVLAARG